MSEPEKKIVKFPVWDMEIDEIIEMEMDEEDYNAMVEAENQEEKRREECRKRQREEEWENLRWIRDDD